MRGDLLPAFIALVDRIEECHRVGHVDHDGKAVLRGRVPDWIQAGIIHPDETILIVVDVQAEGLPDLEAFCAGLLLGDEAASCPIGKTGAIGPPLAPIDAAEDPEASGGRGLE